MAKFLMSLAFPFVLRGVSCREFSSGMEAGTWEWHRKVASQTHTDLLLLARSGCKKSQKKIFWRFWAKCVTAARQLTGKPGDRNKDRATMFFDKAGCEGRGFGFSLTTDIVGTYTSMLFNGWKFKTDFPTAKKFVQFWIDLDLRRSLYSSAYIDHIGERACVLFSRGFTGKEAWGLLIGRKNVLRDSACVTVGASAKALRGARKLMVAAHKFGFFRTFLQAFTIRNRDAERIASMSIWGVLTVLADILASSEEAYENEKAHGNEVESNYGNYRCFDFSNVADISFKTVQGENSPFLGNSGVFRSTVPIRWEKVAEATKGRGWKVKLLERLGAYSGNLLYRPLSDLGNRTQEGKAHYLYASAWLWFIPKPLWFEAIHRENPDEIWEEVKYLLEKGDQGLTLPELRQPILAKWRKLCAETPQEIGSEFEWRIYLWRLLIAFGGNVQETNSFLKTVGTLFVTGDRETPWHFAANNFGYEPSKLKTLLKWGKVWIATRTTPILSDIILVSNKWEEAYGDGRKFEEARSHAAGKLYTNVTPEMVKVCAPLNMSQYQADEYKAWLTANAVKTSESIPAPRAEVGGFGVRQLQHNDLLGPLLGIATHCCQHPRGAASATARQGWISPNGAFWVVERDGKLVAMTHVWRNEENVVLDSLEYSSEWEDAVRGGCVGMALRDAARSIVGRLGVVNVFCGAGHTSKSATIGGHPDDVFGSIDSPQGECLYRGDSYIVWRMA